MNDDKSANEDEVTFEQWFMVHFPVETYIAKQIQSKLNGIFNMFPTRLDKIYPIDFRVEEKNGTLNFTTSEVGVAFLGILGKSIVESISANIEKNIASNLEKEMEEHAKEAVKSHLSKADYSVKLQDFKRCPECKLDNDYKNKFCGECGAKLEE